MVDQYPIQFDEAPSLGTTIRYYRGRLLKLVAIAPYTRVDGRESAVLTWETPKGRRCTSGLRCKAVRWPDGAI
ncbi:hypothetical protein [Rhodovulum sp. MB263]|uniref:hypothetical protein n=1 Tax=Rhodovulum sp. (strain MB263) TaxID=308754 RepID=UPI0009B76FF7|nr:hypothetical protein [Rhodovulum sp. MB263]ARC87392.1 hypothetical protein B5V46_01480 [Rhodovulum sp. MB263]